MSMTASRLFFLKQLTKVSAPMEDMLYAQFWSMLLLFGTLVLQLSWKKILIGLQGSMPVFRLFMVYRRHITPVNVKFATVPNFTISGAETWEYGPQNRPNLEFCLQICPQGQLVSTVCTRTCTNCANFCPFFHGTNQTKSKTMSSA